MTDNQFSAFFRSPRPLPKVVENSLPSGLPKTAKTFETWADLVSNVMSSRSEMFNRLMDPRRNIDEECGYPVLGSVTAWQYYELFRKEPVASRVVTCFPEECWQTPPEVYESEDAESPTPFEQAFEDLGDNLRGECSYYKDEEKTSHPLWDYLARLDRLAGIGSYGVMLIGIDDGLPLDQPVKGWTEENTFPVDYVREHQVPGQGLAPGASEVRDAQEKQAEERLGTILPLNQASKSPPPPPDVYPKYKLTVNEKKTKNRKILYLRVFPEHLAQITKFESNPSSPRFGQPVEYQITFNDPRENNVGAIGLTTATLNVHWTRVVHVADNLVSSEVFGTPRQEPVLRRLLDLEKLYGGSAEMYWRCASPGLSFETHPQLGGDVDVDKASLRDEYENYVNGLQRALFLMGMTARTISPSIVDPNSYIERQIEAICIRLSIPIRIFKGSERGELASGQDDGTWNDRVRGRQRNFVSPRVIIPTIDRFIQIGVLPKPNYKPAPKPAPTLPGQFPPLGADGKPLDSSALDPNKEVPDQATGQASPATPGAVGLREGGKTNGFPPKAPATPAFPPKRKPAFPTRNAFPPTPSDEDTPTPTEKPERPGDPKALFTKDGNGRPPSPAGPTAPFPPKGSVPPNEQNPYGMESAQPVTPSKLGYSVYWPDVQASSEAQKVQIASAKTQALSAYIAGQVNTLIPEVEYLTRFMGLTEDEALKMVEQSQAAKEEQELIDMEKQIQAVEEGLVPDMSDPKALEAMTPKGGPPGFGGPPKPPGAGGGPLGFGGGGPKKPPFGGPKGKPPFVKNVFDPSQPRDPEGRWTSGNNPAKVMKEFDLYDETSRQIAYDALTDAGWDYAREELRSLEAKGVKREQIERVVQGYEKALEIASMLDPEEVWTRERAATGKGYNAKKAREIFSREPKTKLVIVSDEAPTKQGLKIIHIPSYLVDGLSGAVTYYRKSSGGRFGRSAQEMYVTNTFDPSQPRDDHGKWRSASTSGHARKEAELNPTRSAATEGAARLVGESTEASRGVRELSYKVTEDSDDFFSEELYDKLSVPAEARNLLELAKTFNDLSAEASARAGNLSYSKSERDLYHQMAVSHHNDAAKMLNGIVLRRYQSDRAAKLRDDHRFAAKLHEDALKFLREDNTLNAFDPDQPRGDDGKWSKVPATPGAAGLRGGPTMRHQSVTVGDKRRSRAEDVGDATRASAHIREALQKGVDDFQERWKGNLNPQLDHRLNDLGVALFSTGKYGNYYGNHKLQSEAVYAVAKQGAEDITKYIDALKGRRLAPALGRMLKELTALRDDLEEGSRMANDVREDLTGNAFDPSQPRDSDGKWSKVEGEIRSIGRGFSAEEEASEASREAAKVTPDLSYTTKAFLEELVKDGLFPLNGSASWRYATDRNNTADHYSSQTQIYQEEFSKKTNDRASQNYHRWAKESHEDTAKYLEELVPLLKRSDALHHYFAKDIERIKSLAKRHREAAALHHDAAEMLIGNAEGENCGTGAGGFKEGNTCGGKGRIEYRSPGSSEQSKIEAMKVTDALSADVLDDLTRTWEEPQELEDNHPEIYRHLFHLQVLINHPEKKDRDHYLELEDAAKSLREELESRKSRLTGEGKKWKATRSRWISLLRELEAISHDTAEDLTGNAGGPPVHEVESALPPERAVVELKSFLGVR